MKAIKFFSRQGLVLKEVPTPRLKEGDILVKVKACAICGSDARILKGEKKVPEGVTLGHEISGVVHESKNPSFEEGKKVTIFPSIFCQECENCKRKLFNLCLNKKSLGYALDGGFAEFVRIPKTLIELKGVITTEIKDFAVASLVEPLACVLNSFEIMNLTQDSSLLIIGAGPLGLMHALIASIKGIKNVSIVDPHLERRTMAKKLCPHIDTYKDIKEIDNATFTAVAMCAFAPEILEETISLCKAKGIVNLFAGGSWHKKATISPNEIHYKEKILTGTHSTTPELFKKAELIAKRYEDLLQKIVTHRFPLTDYKKAFETYIKRKGLKVVFTP